MARLAIQGSPKTYTKKGDSGKEVVSKFCPNCGSTILSEAFPEDVQALYKTLSAAYASQNIINLKLVADLGQ